MAGTEPMAGTLGDSGDSGALETIRLQVLKKNRGSNFQVYGWKSKNWDTPKWMVKIMENPIKIGDLGGKPIILGNPHISVGIVTVHYIRQHPSLYPEYTT